MVEYQCIIVERCSGQPALFAKRGNMANTAAQPRTGPRSYGDGYAQTEIQDPVITMAISRPNAIKNAAALKKYCDGVKLLKQEFTGPTAKTLGIVGNPTMTKISTYDLFVT